MSEWNKGDIALQLNHGIIGRVVGFGVLNGEPPFSSDILTLKLESGDELMAGGCVRGTLSQLQFHDSAINTVGEALKALAVFGASRGLHPTTALLILKGVMARQSALLNQPGGSDDHQAEQ
jgi:hypothetical protein